jgi:hypothetical protein
MVQARHGVDISISYLWGTVKSCSLQGDPHPQYFSSGFIRLPQDFQTYGMTGSGTTCGGKFDCWDKGNGEVSPATGNGSRTDSGKGVTVGVTGSWGATYFDAP